RPCGCKRLSRGFVPVNVNLITRSLSHRARPYHVDRNVRSLTRKACRHGWSALVRLRSGLPVSIQAKPREYRSVGAVKSRNSEIHGLDRDSALWNVRSTCERDCRLALCLPWTDARYLKRDGVASDGLWLARHCRRLLFCIGVIDHNRRLTRTS